MDNSLMRGMSAGAWIGAHGPVATGGLRWTLFEDSDDFLLSLGPYDHAFYVVALSQRGVSGVDLVRLIRRRTTAGLLALSQPPHAHLARAFDMGADVVLPAGSEIAVLTAAIAAVQRRIAQLQPVALSDVSWRLVPATATLHAPDGAIIALSPSELQIMRAFAQSEHGTVGREALAASLWGDGAPVMENALHAALYRLRKRIEKSGQRLWPIYAVAGVGYEFRAPLRMA